ncbi:MAG: XdhC family protein [Bacillota bacterium]
MKGLDPGQELVIVTVIDQKGLPREIAGKKKVFSPAGEAGDLTLPWLEGEASRLAGDAMVTGNFKVVDLAAPGARDQAVTLMVEPYLLPSELIILGGGHIALPLVKLGKLLGYRVAVIDDRPEFASGARFPEADRVVCRSFDDIMKNLTPGPRSSVIIVTRGHRHDLDCLRQMLEYPLAYLGMIGSRRKIHAVRRQLIEEGFAEERIDRVHMPIGLDIGAQTPEEIAVSIAAELVRERRGGSAPSLGASEMPSALDREILIKAVNSAGGDMPAALATIVRTRGSTPRKAGARMLVYRDGRTFGTVGGGCGESEVRREAFNVIDEASPRLYKVSLDADTAAAGGMVCGGVMEIFIEPAESVAGVFRQGWGQ